MSKEGNKAPLFDLFWANTNLNSRNILNFVRDFDSEETDIGKIKYPTVDFELKYPKDRLFKVMSQRRSEREYGDYQMNEKELSSLFSCFAEIGSHRLLPSAGGKYPIEVYAMCFNVKGALNGKTVYCDCRANALSIVGSCGSWLDVEKFTGNDGLIKGTPSIMFLFAAFASRVVSKYGERGGRFLLIEAGHYLQNLSLRVAFENLKAVELGGLFDDDIKRCLGLANTEAIITSGMICGR